jgi:hypothetical protein
MPTDFRNGKAFPRSGRERKGDAMWLLRVYDKARAVAAGTHDDYIYPCPMDKGVMERWGVTPQDFDAAIAVNRDDDAMYAWLQSRASGEAIAAANHWLVSEKAENLDRQDTEERP